MTAIPTTIESVKAVCEKLECGPKNAGTSNYGGKGSMGKIRHAAGAQQSASGSTSELRTKKK